MVGQGRRRRTSRIFRTLLLALLLATAGVPAANAAISVGDVTVSESSAEASFTVTRTAGLLTGNATVAFSTVDGTAGAPADYTALPSGALFFGSLPLGGAQTQVVKVAITPDALHEPAETFRLLLSGSAEIVDGEGVATILDDDDPPPPPPPSPPPPSPPSTPAAEEPAPAAAQAAPDVALAPVADGPSPSTAIARASELGLSRPRLRRPSIMLVTVSCPRATNRCSGRVTIFSRPNPRSRIKALRRERRLGQRNFTLLSGATRTLTIALSRSDRVLLMRTGRMLVRAYAVTRDGNGRSSVRRSSGTLIARTSHS